jgi:hypothetical protein
MNVWLLNNVGCPVSAYLTYLSLTGVNKKRITEIHESSMNALGDLCFDFLPYP